MGRLAYALALTCALALILAGCGGSSSAGVPNPKASFDQLLGDGTKLLAEGKDKAAIATFEAAIAKKPKSPVGYYDAGVVYQREGQRHSSLVKYAQAMHEDANYVPALYNYGLAFEQQRPQITMYFLRKVIKLQPDSASALLELGHLTYVNEPRARPQALRLLKAAVVLEPSLYSAIPAPLRAAVRKVKPLKRSKRAKGPRGSKTPKPSR